MKTVLEKNREYSEKFIQPIKNPKLPNEIKNILEKEKIKSMIDLGCGDGAIVEAVKKEFPRISIFGVDISSRRINRLKEKFPKEKFFISDVCNTKLKERFDFVYTSQVIEHVEDDKKMVKEINKLLKKNGILFCSSVIKKPWAIYQYRNNGKFVLDPTHEREYKNEKDFLGLFKNDFTLEKYGISKTKRKKFGITFRIPGFYEVWGIWIKK